MDAIGLDLEPYCSPNAVSDLKGINDDEEAQMDYATGE